MTTQPEGRWVVPNPQVPRTFGILNIVFGVILLLFGLWTLLATLYAGTFQRWVTSTVDAQVATQKAERQAKIAELKRQEGAAKTEEEKDGLKTEREALEKRTEIDVRAMTDMSYFTNDPRIKIYTYSETITGILLNIAMIIAGIGLLRCAERARQVSLWVAGLKLLRWVSIVIVSLVLIVPMTTRHTKKSLDSIQAQINAQQGGQKAPAGAMAFAVEFGAIASAISVIFSALVASIYPLFQLWFLTRPPARAACLPREKPPSPAPDLDLGATS